MKTIFISIPWFDPAYKAGGPVQSIVNLLREYRPGEVNIKIYTSAVDLDGSVNKGVAFNQWCNYNDYTQVWYATANRLSIAGMRDAFNQSGAATLFIMGIYSWNFNLVPLLFCRAENKIISVRGMLHPGALSQKSIKKKGFLLLWKLFGWHRRVIFHATDETESRFIYAVFGSTARVAIAGNYPRVLGFQQVEQKNIGELKMVSIALLSPMKNIALVLEALVNCRAKIQYDIYGPVKDHDYWRECLLVIPRLPANISVHHYGGVSPKEVEELLKAYAVFILPSKSENFGHAIFEALTAGKPVVTSRFTPFNNLHENKAGTNVSLDSVDEITAAIEFFAAMPKVEFETWNKRARNFALQYLKREELKQQYDRMFGIVDNQ